MSDLFHVSPIDDVRDHVTNDGPYCPCLPEVVNDVVIHFSYDRREVHETAIVALYELGLALALQGLPIHKWPDSLRRHYHRAMELLQGGPCCSKEIDQETLERLMSP